jgi:hypothetical protein
LTVAEERERGLGLVHLILIGARGLIEAFRAGGLNVSLSTPFDGGGFTLAKALTAGALSFERIVGEIFHLQPLGSTVEMRTGLLQSP